MEKLNHNPSCMQWTMKLWMLYFLLVLMGCNLAWGPNSITGTNRLELRDKVLEMFHHAYGAYMQHAYPADELMPIACKGRIRGVTPSRGDVDDALGNFSLTLVDTLDTLAVLGLYDDFEDAVQRVQKDVSFDADLTVSVFETNIRMLGGLLGGHSAALEIQKVHNRMQWYNGSLLSMAKDLGDRLLPAFNTTSGMPLSRINLLTGVTRPDKDRDTCTACAGTMILEMAALSRFTGDPIYETRARSALDYLWSRRQRSSDLMGTVLNVENGEWVRKESGIGAGIDSYYEYLLKAYIFLGDEIFLERFNTHYQAIKQYCSQGPLVIDVLMHKPTTSARNFVDALSAFWPGLQVLKGDVKSAIETHELLYQVFNKHTFLPEAFTTNFDIHWGQYPLRPEFAESTYLLYKATGDPYYLEVGKSIVENLESKARVGCGFAGIKDVRTFKHEDRMDSYFLAEMFKYLYLLFTPNSESLGINIENYVLTTEAHILPLKLSLKSASSGNQSFEAVTSPVNAEDNFERSCPNSPYVRIGNLKTIQDLRSKVYTESASTSSHSTPSMCQNQQQQQFASTINWEGNRQLHGRDFVPGKEEHASILKKMGISIMVLSDGKVQLVQHRNTAISAKDAAEGELFMREMIEISKSAGAPMKPVHVRLMSPPFSGAMAFRGAPAQFGPSIESIGAVRGGIVIADPFDACSPLKNTDAVKGNIVLSRRGQCMFVHKVSSIERAGGIAAIIIDNTPGSYESSPPFQMAGDDRTHTDIPAIFLFSSEGNTLRQAVLDSESELFQVFISNKLSNDDDETKSSKESEDAKSSESDQGDETSKDDLPPLNQNEEATNEDKDTDNTPPIHIYDDTLDTNPKERNDNKSDQEDTEAKDEL